LYLNINIFIKIHKPTTTSQRFKKSTFLTKFPRIKKFFKIFLKNNSGRNNSGCITILSKGVRRKINTTPVVRPLIWDKNLSVIVSILRNKKKLISVSKHITGSFSIKPLVLGSFINQKTFSSNLSNSF
jgi:hypothetical protein